MDKNQKIIDAGMNGNLSESGKITLGIVTTSAINTGASADGVTHTNYMDCHDWWHQYYYPAYYPGYYQSTIYIDKGQKAIELVKVLMDSDVIKVDTVKQYVDVLDKIIKII